MSREPYRRIVVGADGSPTARRAVLGAAALAVRTGSPLTVATGWYRDMPEQPAPSELAEWPADSAGAMEAQWASTTVADAAADARRVGLEDVDTATPQGAPADGLIALVEDDPDALLVVGTVGLGSRAERMLGNVPHQVTHHAPVDVLLVRTAGGERDGVFGTVVLATDGSETASRAVTRGLALARAVGAEATLLTVAGSRDAGEEVLERVAGTLPDGSELGRRAEAGRDVAGVLAEVAGDYDLLVIGNKGMSGPSRLLGSVANGVTHRVPTDLLLVNTTKRP